MSKTRAFMITTILSVVIGALIAEHAVAQDRQSSAAVWRQLDPPTKHAYVLGFSHGTEAARAIMKDRSGLTDTQLDGLLRWLTVEPPDFQAMIDLMDSLYADPANGRVHLYAAAQYAAMTLFGATEAERNAFLELARRLGSGGAHP